MHQRTQPHPDPMRAAEFLLADQDVQAAVPVVDAAADVLRQAVLFHPVDFEEAEGSAVEAADHWDGVSRCEAVLEEFFLVLYGAVFAPAVGDAGVVHPFVEELKVGHSGGFFGFAVVVGVDGGDAGVGVGGHASEDFSRRC